MTVASQPRSGGTLRAAITSDIAGLEPHISPPNAFETVWLVYDRLTAYDDKLNPQPALAESWETGDFTSIKLNLRPGVQFHSGRELTSDDVKWNMQRVKDPNAGGQTVVVGLKAQANWFTNFETPDKYTVILKSDQPRPAVFDWLEYLNIADRDSLEGPDAKTKAVGTGPFVFVEWVPGDHVSFTRNTSYWATSRPYLDGVSVRVITDVQAQLAFLESGNLDIMKTPPLLDFVRLKADPNYQAFVHPYSGQHFLLGVNVGIPPWDNKLARQALNYAIDRQRWADSVSKGAYEPRSLPWNQGSPAYEAAKETAYAFDLDKARSLLAQANVTNASIEILPFTDFPELANDFSEMYQANLAQLGITLSIRKMDSATWVDQIVNRKYNSLYVTANTLAQMEPITEFIQSRPFDPVMNNSGYTNDQYTQLIRSAEVEPDAAKRKALYSQLNDIILDESWAMPIASGAPRYVARSSLHEVGYTLHEAFSYTDAWLGA
jgi:peptide/nickel transport system substrate-binding protein